MVPATTVLPFTCVVSWWHPPPSSPGTAPLSCHVDEHKYIHIMLYLFLSLTSYISPPSLTSLTLTLLACFHRYHPTLTPCSCPSSQVMELCCLVGAVLALLMMAFRAMRSSLLFLVLWALYLSLYKVHVHVVCMYTWIVRHIHIVSNVPSTDRASTLLCVYMYMYCKVMVYHPLR